MKKFKTGIVGCGRIGSILEEDPLRGKPCTHAGGFSALPAIHLSAGCDIDPERLKEFGKRWHVTGLYSDYREMLEKENTYLKDRIIQLENLLDRQTEIAERHTLLLAQEQASRIKALPRPAGWIRRIFSLNST